MICQIVFYVTAAEAQYSLLMGTNLEEMLLQLILAFLYSEQVIKFEH